MLRDRRLRARPIIRARPAVRVGVLAGSPVPFKVALYRRLSAEETVDLTVIYASSLGVRRTTVAWGGYSEPIVWDLDLLGGYKSHFLRRAHRNRGYGVGFSDLADPDVVPLLTRKRFDVLWLEGYSSVTHLLAMGTQRVKRLGLVMREEQTLLNPRQLQKTLLKEVLLRALFSNLDAAVYISRENRRALEHYGLPPQRLFASPYTPDSDFFAGEAQRLRPQRQALRREFGFEESVGPIILTISRLVPNKQPGMVLEAFKRVRSQRRCGLLIIGSGTLEEGLRATVARERIPDVRFGGFLNQSQVSRAYAASDVFVLLSESGETFGLAAAEAMHFDLPLVLSDKVGCGPDLVGNSYNGFIVDRDDVAAAASALERLVADPELRARLGIGSRERIAAWGPAEAAAGALAAIQYADQRRVMRSRPIATS